MDSWGCMDAWFRSRWFWAGMGWGIRNVNTLFIPQDFAFSLVCCMNITPDFCNQNSICEREWEWDGEIDSMIQWNGLGCIYAFNSISISIFVFNFSIYWFDLIYWFEHGK